MTNSKTTHHVPKKAKDLYRVPEGCKKAIAESCPDLTILTIPEGCEYVHVWDCHSLANLTIPEDCKKVQVWCCNALRNLTIPEGCEYVRGEYCPKTIEPRMTALEALKADLGRANSIVTESVAQEASKAWMAAEAEAAYREELAKSAGAFAEATAWKFKFAEAKALKSKTEATWRITCDAEKDARAAWYTTHLARRDAKAARDTATEAFAALRDEYCGSGEPQ